MSSSEGDRTAWQGLLHGIVWLSMPHEAGACERFEVNAAVCELEAADGMRLVNVVELAYYQDHRYSLVIMTATEARDLARLLTDAADECPPPVESREGAQVLPVNPDHLAGE